jgi:glucose/arabinose dehydrogenase
MLRRFLDVSFGRFARLAAAVAVVGWSFSSLALGLPAQAAPALPANYSVQTVTQGLNFPTNTAWLPDGAMLIAEKAGTVKVFRGGTLQAQPVIDIRSSTNDYWDRGLLGLAVDPEYNTNHYVYLLRTHENNPAQYEGTKVSQLVRVTLNDAGTAMVPGSLTVLLGTSTPASCQDVAITADCIPADGASHSVGDVVFASDGTIFVTSGDASSFTEADPKALRAQNLDSLAGKMLHIDRNGQGVASNPYFTGNANDNRSKVWASGLRNPWRFTMKPGTTTPYLTDVGWGDWEEVNVMTAGGNYGWPCYEGAQPQNQYKNMSVCQTLINQVNNGQASVKSPLVSYSHAGSDAAVAGGAFVTGTTYPDALKGSYIYGDYAKEFLRTLRTNDAHQLTSGPTDFGTQMGGIVNTEQGPDGYLYLTNITDNTFSPNTGRILRLDYANTPPPPPGQCNAGQYQAQYFNNKTLTGTPAVTRCEASPLDRDWALGSPVAGVNTDNFSARYTGSFDFTEGTYSFDAWGDDGVRILVDNELVVNGWKDQGVTHYQATKTLTAGSHTVIVEYFDSGEDAVVKANWTKQSGGGGGGGGTECVNGQYKSEFFNNTTLGGAAAVTRCEDAPINHNWGLGSPGSGINTDNFSARYTGSFDLAAGDYQFTTSADDGVRLFIDGNQVINGWKDQGETTYTATRTLTAGTHVIKVEYYDSGEDAVLRANWQSVGTTNLAPTPTISVPSDNATIAPGATVNFEGYATDLEDGTLAASKLNWNTVIQHCASGSCHSHFLQQWTGVAGGSFTYPDHGQDEYYVELSLIATDSNGAQTTKKIRLNPQRTTPPPPPPGQCTTGQFKAEYFNNKTLAGTPIATACTNDVNFNWILASPASGVNADNFSARFTATKTFTAGSYVFSATGDDGIRLFLDGTRVINGWKNQAATTYKTTRTLTAGDHTLKLEFYDATEDAVAKLSWTKQ